MQKQTIKTKEVFKKVILQTVDILVEAIRTRFKIENIGPKRLKNCLNKSKRSRESK